MYYWWSFCSQLIIKSRLSHESFLIQRNVSHVTHAVSFHMWFFTRLICHVISTVIWVQLVYVHVWLLYKIHSFSHDLHTNSLIFTHDRYKFTWFAVTLHGFDDVFDPRNKTFTFSHRVLNSHVWFYIRVWLTNTSERSVSVEKLNI